MNERSVRILLGISVFGFGVLGGAVVERTWYEPPRVAMIEEKERTIRAHEARVLASERDGLSRGAESESAPAFVATTLDMDHWLHSLSVMWRTLVVFAATALVTG